MTQEHFFDCDNKPTVDFSKIQFNGADYQAPRDQERLSGQLFDIFEYMKNGMWRTLADISLSTGHPEASISAQLRHLRKPRFGSHTVNREYIDNGLYRYQLILNK